jgi:hypothetical protein
MDSIQNRTFDELKAGETASLARTLTYKAIELFAIISGDVNPRMSMKCLPRATCSTRWSPRARGAGC